MLLSCALALALSARPAAAADDEGYAMNDVGATLTLPRGWEMQEWSDWNFKAKTSDGVLMRLYLTPFQVEPSPAAATAWAGMFQQELEGEGGADFAPPAVGVADISLQGSTRKAATADLSFTFEKQATKGVLHAVSFPAKGQTVHIETITAARNDKAGSAALSSLLANLHIDQGPLDTGPARVSTDAGFAFSAPEGWRAPLSGELSGTRKVTGRVGESDLKPERCAALIRPPAVGDPDVIFACSLYKHLGIVDAYSFEGVEAEVYQLFFGKADKPVDHAAQVQVGDRLGFLYRPPVAGHAVRLAVAPYDKGVVVMWAMGNHLDDAGIDAAVQAVLPTVEYTDPDGGQPIVALDKRVSYYLSYRPTSPVVLGPAIGLVLLIGGGVLLARKRTPAYHDDDTHV